MKIHVFILVVFSYFLFYSCTTNKFSALSKYNEFDESQRYVIYKNDTVGIESRTFGDFTFPVSNKEVKKIRKGRIPFNNILLYANTLNPAYEYYILIDYKKKNRLYKKYLRKDTIVDGKTFSFIASKNIPKSDWKFIVSNIHFKNMQKSSK
ncbi:hypothetical protein [Bergeyella sp. RCAD1439]|uniref:hypothetical protein n=1 Tax=Bergeyella anatis TaxID=3113737 RepID=UPI002E170931|nr:hypothetical protein [Bergeyella sp. RCAD1439]